MIISAKDLNVSLTREKIIDCFCDAIMEKIKKRVEEGGNKVCFNACLWYYEPTNEIATHPKYDEWKERDKWDCSKYYFSDYKEEVKERFLKAGYIIKPTGYIGGVYQTTEDIMW